jgi:hypothetical protein
MTLAETDHSMLADGFAGEIIVPSDPSYDGPGPSSTR